MMDGQVAAIRAALDDAGFTDTAIMSYAAKFASAFYGPFREAAECAPQFGDRAGYQMDPANAREALREVQLDLDEGADMAMVKPALAYLDVIARVRDAVHVPVAAYNVSGRSAVIHAAGVLHGRPGVASTSTSTSTVRARARYAHAHARARARLMFGHISTPRRAASPIRDRAASVSRVQGRAIRDRDG